jgi:hypothetical protein
MTTLGSLQAWKRCPIAFLIALSASPLFSASSAAQSSNGYVLGDDPHLEMMVHIIGEVQRPGEFRVPDNTNVLELFSKAGGPTQFSDLSRVTITRHRNPLFAANSPGGTSQPSAQLLEVNLKEALTTDKAAALPVLLPGDVVVVPRNSWSSWRNFAAVARDISVIAGIYLIFSATRD